MLSAARTKRARTEHGALGYKLQERFIQRALLAKLIKFLIIGGSGVLVNTAALFFLYQIARLPLLAASALAVELAIVNGFLWNNRWTFGRRTLSLGRFLRYHAVSLGGLVITTGTLWLLVRYAGILYLTANLVGIVLATAWNFCANVLWTWKEVS